MAKSTVVAFDIPSEFSADPLTAVIQAGAKGVLRTAVQAEMSAFIGEHAHLLDQEGRQRLVRRGFLPEREVMTGIGTFLLRCRAYATVAQTRTAPRSSSTRRWSRLICARRSRSKSCCLGCT